MKNPIIFSASLANEVGVNGAIILQNFAFWIMKNKAQNKNYYDGHYWTYNGSKELLKIFSFWSRRTLEYEIHKLQNNDYIRVGNYNKMPYDKTKWYSLTEKSLQLLKQCDALKSTYECTNLCKDNVQKCTKTMFKNVQAIPDVYHNNNSSIKKEKYKKEKNPVESSVSTEPTLFSPTVKDTHNFDKHNLEADFEKLWQMYPCKQGKTKAYEKFVKAVKSGVEVSKIEDGLKRYNQYIKVHNVEREFIKHGSTWFNQRCWEDEYDLTPPKPKASVPEVKPPPKPYLYDDPMAGGRWVL